MTHRLFLLIGDWLILYCSLALVVFLRYGAGEFSVRFQDHALPFSLLFLGWLFVFFMADLYSPRVISSTKTLLQRLFAAFSANLVLSVFAFYLLGPIFSLTPKTNLLLLLFLSFSFVGLWRIWTLRVSPRGKTRVLFVGKSPSIPVLISHLAAHPHLGYEVLAHVPRPASKKIQEALAEQSPDLLVFSSEIASHSTLFSLKADFVRAPLSFLPLQDFYSSIFEKISLEDVDGAWITRCVSRQDRAYDAAKRVFESCFGVLLALFFLPLMLLLGFLVRITSSGPAIFAQKRMGRGSKPFVLYKFRTMRHNNTGPLWTEPHDPRITPFGRFLRFTHLDELPQLWNIIRGDISFTGPRPERYELAEQYRELPYYDLRHLVKPGLTGWAQINFRPSASLLEAREKLAYDLYYVANRSFSLDVVLALKTIRHFFFSHF